MTPEFRLVVACSMWPPSERRDAAIRAAAAEVQDWRYFQRVVQRQCTAGLVKDGLKRACIDIPSDVGREIAALAADITHKNILFAAECFRVQRQLDAAGLSNLILKGVPLAQLAYHGLALKHARDIDLLTTPEDVPWALRSLEDLGYRSFPSLLSMPDVLYRRHVKYKRDCVLFHDSLPVFIELHWKLLSNEYFLKGVSAASLSQRVEISPGVELRTLAEPNLFSYICAHGAMHSWSRLKWLAEVAALMANDTASDAERRLEAARHQNVEHCVAQAFLLCDTLFNMPNVSAIAKKLRRRIRYRWLERIALGAMMHGNAETELGHASFDYVPIFTSHFLLGRGLRYAANELWIKLNGPTDHSHISLPEWLQFLYPVFRVAAWLKRRGRFRPRLLPPDAKP